MYKQSYFVLITNVQNGLWAKFKLNRCSFSYANEEVSCFLPSLFFVQLGIAINFPMMHSWGLEKSSSCEALSRP